MVKSGERKSRNAIGRFPGLNIEKCFRARNWMLCLKAGISLTNVEYEI